MVKNSQSIKYASESEKEGQIDCAKSFSIDTPITFGWLGFDQLQG